tara:strand:+ start:509 stop:1069 length:561 start_codon:yes stop_codon:yes gene_type:complete
MKKFAYIFLILITSLSFSSCSNKESEYLDYVDSIFEPIHIKNSEIFNLQKENPYIVEPWIINKKEHEWRIAKGSNVDRAVKLMDEYHKLLNEQSSLIISARNKLNVRNDTNVPKNCIAFRDEIIYDLDAQWDLNYSYLRLSGAPGIEMYNHDGDTKVPEFLRYLREDTIRFYDSQTRTKIARKYCK